MEASASTSEAERFKIHRTTAAILPRRYARLSADHQQPGFAVGFGRTAEGRDCVQHQARAVPVQAATADKASSR
jgi:hypothetical protein